jgi:hypothetical protein
MPKAAPSKRQVVLHKLEALAQSTMHTPEAETARAKAEELKIHTEHVQVAPVNVGRDHGAITIGHWFRDGDTVVVCDSDGVPRHQPFCGEQGQAFAEPRRTTGRPPVDQENARRRPERWVL